MNEQKAKQTLDNIEQFYCDLHAPRDYAEPITSKAESGWTVLAYFALGVVVGFMFGIGI